MINFKKNNIMINRKCVYFAADRAGCVFMFNEKPTIDMEFSYEQGQLMPIGDYANWKVVKKISGAFGRYNDYNDYGVEISQEMFNKITGDYLTFENSPYKIEL